MPLCLEAVKQRQMIPLDKAVLLFGRHPDCDVVLAQSAKISRKHCCIMHVNAQCVLRDLGSTNGVHLNGQRVKRIAILKHGDQLAIGDVIFRVAAYSKPQGGNGAKPHGVSKKPLSSDAQTPTPQPSPKQDFVVEQQFPEVSIPELSQPNRDLSQELPVAIPDEGEFFAPRSDPSFQEVVDHGVPLADDDDSSLAPGGDSQVDVILLDDPHESSDADADDDD